MGLQQQVGLHYSPGIAGDRASRNPSIYTPYNPVATSEVTVGQFVWPGTYEFTEAQASSSSAVQPLGLVERVLVNYNYNLTSPGTMVLAAGTVLTVARKGDYFVKPTAAVTIGQKVFASLTDGSISGADTGATVDGAVETDWVVKNYDSVSGIATISNWDFLSAS